MQLLGFIDNYIPAIAYPAGLYHISAHALQVCIMFLPGLYLFGPVFVAPCTSLRLDPHHTCQPSRISRDYTGKWGYIPVSRKNTSNSRITVQCVNMHMCITCRTPNSGWSRPYPENSHVLLLVLVSVSRIRVHDVFEWQPE